MPYRVEPKHPCASCGGQCSRRSPRCWRCKRNGPVPDPAKAAVCIVCGQYSRNRRCARCAGLARRARTGSLPRACAQCGLEYLPRYGRTQGLKFCSLACYRARQHERRALRTQNCEQCGRSFVRTSAAVTRSRRCFCGQACFRVASGGRSNSMFRGGRDSSRGPGWLRLAKSIRVRDGHMCQSCGRTQQENGQKLSVDHVLPWRLFDDKAAANDPKNLTSVCKWCHSRKTSGAERKYLQGDVLDFQSYQRSLTIGRA